jgi:hypothetical protein
VVPCLERAAISELPSFAVTAFAWYLLIALFFMLAFLGVRATFCELRRVPQPRRVDHLYRSRMGIRHWMATTLACGVLLTGTRLADPNGDVGPLVMCVVLIGAAVLVVVWASLAPGRTLLRLALAMAAAVGVVALITVQFDTNWQEAASLLPGIVLVAVSLLVVRGAGYRLLRCDYLLEAWRRRGELDLW